MDNINRIWTDEYNYELPGSRIADFPLSERDKAKLLIYVRNKPLVHDLFMNLAKYISKDNLVVFNNTKVIQARLNFKKETGANIEIFCLQPVDPAGYEAAFKQKTSCVWNCIVGNLKKWKTKKLQKEFPYKGTIYKLVAKKEKTVGDPLNIEFSWDNPGLSFADILEINGSTPLPPYIKRKTVKSDKERYQTIYSKYCGSVAAPTAGLHISKKVIDDLKSKNIKSVELTLHVGAGTFQPVKEKYANDHILHTEQFIIGREAVKMLRNSIGRIIAVGTTTVRTLESLYWLGVKLGDHKKNFNETLKLEQWEAYNLRQDADTGKSLECIEDYMKYNGTEEFLVETRFMIIPGYKFRLTKGMITNFHMPKSTLLMLVAAFTGNSWRDIYNYALKNDFRFLSYGDCSLLITD